MKFGSWASTAGGAVASGTAWTCEAGARGVAIMEEEQALMEVLRLEEGVEQAVKKVPPSSSCLLYTSDAADE